MDSARSSHSSHLANEAAFADAAYAQGDDLRLNPVMYRKYSHPYKDWDWREYGIRRLGSVDNCQLLDLGCGQGEETTYFAKLGARVTAIDISPVGISRVHQRASVNGVADRVTAVLGRVDPTPFTDHSFDVVHGFGILHHIGLETGLAETRRLLRLGGRAIFFEHMGNAPELAVLQRYLFRESYTNDEQPLRWVDVAHATRDWRLVELTPFHLLSRFRRFFPRAIKSTGLRLDAFSLRLCPPLRRYASGLVIYLEL